ncbi:tyrosine-type recombinase/integrase [Geobacter sp.]|uniref:tyrosine-type recombinase/integrase n=1 Tax=Geobacter sp. TaxID=46610 RepID=UPI0027B90411|nr:tyrosine-type recombinase/integrase [Geobacter sp.]
MDKVRNHPKIGDRIKVQPIRCIEDVNRVKVLLRNNVRDLALFSLGVNSALSPSALLHVRVGVVRNLRPGDSFEINGKSVTVNKSIKETIDKLLSAMSVVEDSDFLFQSKKLAGQPLGASTLHRLVKTWCADANLTGNFGSHSLRKTYGYIYRTTFKADLGQLARIFNHAYKRQTVDYLCLPQEELHSICMQEI